MDTGARTGESARVGDIGSHAAAIVSFGIEPTPLALVQPG